MKTTTIKQGLNKLFIKNEQLNELSNALIEKLLVDGNKMETDSIGYVDDNRIFLIYPKNDIIKGFIKNNFKVNEMNTPKLNFKLDDIEIKQQKDKEIASKFSMKYLKSIIKMCEGYEWVQIKMKRNYPISIETDDFKCLLAPRVEPADE